VNERDWAVLFGGHDCSPLGLEASCVLERQEPKPKPPPLGFRGVLRAIWNAEAREKEEGA
jgi:hypothetical protein